MCWQAVAAVVAVMMSPAGVASVQQNKVGGAGLQDECVVPVYKVEVGRHVAFTFHCFTASLRERLYCKKKTKKKTPTPSDIS